MIIILQIVWSYASRPNKCDEALPTLLGEVECAWPEAPTLGGLQKGTPKC